MKYILFLLVILICTTSPVFAQEPKIGDFIDPINPSLFTDKIEIPYHVFNTISRDAEITELENQNSGSWQLSYQNDLLYGNPNGNAVIRIYDVDITDKFLEIGMGSYPDYKYWVAAQVPETGIAGFSNAYTRTQFAVFLPTPGISTSLSISAGTFPLYLERIKFATSIIRFDFT